MSILKMSFTGRRSLALTATAVAVALAATGCGGDSGGSAPTLPGNPGLGGDGVVAQSVYDAAPVATARTSRPAPRWRRSSKRGYLIIGGSLDAPLLSQQNPVDRQVEGFDADMAKLLAKYIIGKPEVKIVDSASETREALLPTATVDVVFQTYTITPSGPSRSPSPGRTTPPAWPSRSGRARPGSPERRGPERQDRHRRGQHPGHPRDPEAAPGAKIVAFGSDPEACRRSSRSAATRTSRTHAARHGAKEDPTDPDRGPAVHHRARTASASSTATRRSRSSSTTG